MPQPVPCALQVEMPVGVQRRMLPGMHLHCDNEESTCQMQNASLQTFHLSEEQAGRSVAARLLHWLVVPQETMVPGAGGGTTAWVTTLGADSSGS